MVPHNCSAVSQYLQIFAKTVLTAVSFTNIKSGDLSKLLNDSSSLTLKKTLSIVIKLSALNLSWGGK